MEGWGIASVSRSVQTESFCINVHIQDVDIDTGCDSNQIRGLFGHHRGHVSMYIHVSILPQHRKFLRFCFRGQTLPILGSSFRSCTLTPRFHQVCGCCSGSTVTPGHLHINNWLILAQLRCHPCPYKKAGVKVWCGIRPR